MMAVTGASPAEPADGQRTAAVVFVQSVTDVVRGGRVSGSRIPLRDAIGLFDALSANRWSERARQQLRATGETVGQRPPDARDRLTAQELQTAQLAVAHNGQ